MRKIANDCGARSEMCRQRQVLQNRWAAPAIGCLLALLSFRASAQASKPAPAPDTRITPAQAQALFHSVDSILQFDANDTGLPILHPVKRRLVTRDEVTEYLSRQLQKDRAAKRLQRDELILKKFGLLPQTFDLKPFLIRLLREQVAGYYDEKTKTVNLLDWIPPDEQKPVLAHELTHALQDQHVNLEKWDEDNEDSVPKNVAQDNQRIRQDEQSTARDAVLEGQAMAVFVDYALRPTGRTLLTSPGLLDHMDQMLADTSDSPTLASAPLMLRRSLEFPYTDGLKLVAAVLAAKGREAAYAGMLDHPPSSSYQVMTPAAYLDHTAVPVLSMPDLHPLLKHEYSPYDVGAMGEFDVEVLAEVFGGKPVARSLAPAWDGGYYYAAQRKDAASADSPQSPDSLALLYVSRWKSSGAAAQFAQLYAQQIPRQYTDAVPDTGNSPEGMDWRWKTSAGPVVIARRGRVVFVSEGFASDVTDKLEAMTVAAAGTMESNLGAMPATPQDGRPAAELGQQLRDSLKALNAALY
jgi:hypothetical protein